MRLAVQKSQMWTAIKDRPPLFWVLNDLRGWLITTFSVAKKTCAETERKYPFLFIVGAGRSGNTLLRRLVMERLSIYIPPETYVLPRVADYRIRGKGLTWPALVDLVVSAFEYYPEFETFNIETLRDYATEAKGWPARRRNIHSLLEGLYCYFARCAGLECKWVGDKTPLNTLYLGQISKVVSGACYIYLLRDGVDVAASYVNAGIYERLEDAAERWVRSQKSWEAFAKRLPKERFLEIHYEEFVTVPDDTVEKVASYFGIPKRPVPVDISQILGDVGHRQHHKNVVGTPSLDSIGKGRRALSASGAERIRPIFSGWLERCGYKKI